MSKRRKDSPEWLAAKASGDDAELAVAEHFKQLDCDVTKTIGHDTYDLKVQSLLVVKHDLQAPRTGNVAIEVSNAGRPSGIMATSADRWVIVVGDTGYVVRTSNLRDFLAENDFANVPAGDGLRSKVRLVPLSTLTNLNIFQTINLSRWLP